MINDDSRVTLSANSDLKPQRMRARRSEEQQVKKAVSGNKPLANGLMENICEPSNLNRAYRRKQ